MARASKPAATKSTATNRSSNGNSGNGGNGGNRSNKIAKTQMIEMVADRTSLNKKQAGDAVACVLEGIVTALQQGKSVGLPGLGTLSVTQTAARQGVRPGTSQRITIPAGKKVRFKAASTLKGTL
ncbi:MULTISPECIES: HU family DNA-binding protein [Deinococcus]|jgi:DNA-binding protein HU-beta|uniref:DNA-binding protein n=2 Tax=Deinococcus TaxID=1298 RepID=A0A221SSK8_9DEIO|nr:MULTISPECIES: HU family DNA-binding protein [Deinococcus]ASN79623.1 DNA-binding protein [Deinococcus ficus]MDP9765989.1 DNA-binding protein HU-beta [Deinococcus enclensis]GHF79365.1 hypothetical protein GCM10017782_16550 [Deinococcus ficus]